MTVKHVQLRMPEGEYAQLRLIAALLGLSPIEFIKEAIKEKLDRSTKNGAR